MKAPANEVPFWSDAEVAAAMRPALAQLELRRVLAYPTETVYGFGGAIVRTVDRTSLWRAQTPQGFPRALLVEAHRRAREERITATDDAALCERLGYVVRVVRGSERALKVTEPGDFARVEALYAMEE